MAEVVMIAGCSSASTKGDVAASSEMSQRIPFAHIPRPLCKRPIEAEVHSAEVKRSKLEPQQSAPQTPETRTTQASEVSPDPPSAPATLLNMQNRQESQTDPALGKAVKVAMNLYRDALIEFELERDLKGDENATKLVVQWAADHYEELRNAILSLLPWTGEREIGKGGTYDVIKFTGCKTTRREVCKTQLRHLRAQGAQAQAWEALCAVLAVISAREEKLWLECHNNQEELDELPKKIPLCKSKRSATRRAAICEMVPKWVEHGAGAFVYYLLDPRSVHCMTLARGPEGPLPATSMTTRRMPLWDALKSMDFAGPLCGQAKDKEWCWAAGRQFALQDLQYGHKQGSRKERISTKDLKPDTQLRDLLRSKKPVLLLDTLAALAPRDVCKNQGLSEIVRTELATLFREAKARGEAVVFLLGSEDPHKLAQRVYLHPPLADQGMRCGNLRWREAADVPWAREYRWNDRNTLCLQMP